MKPHVPLPVCKRRQDKIERAWRAARAQIGAKRRKTKEIRRETAMTKEELAKEIVNRLKKEYPDVGCTLDYDQAWKLLVSVRLAAQCTDARVNVVVQDLYAEYPDVNALADAPVEEIERIVKPW